MSAPQESEDGLAPSQTQGYKLGESKTVAELAALDQEDESLQRWKASLGIGAGGSGGGSKKVVVTTLFLTSSTLPKPIVIDTTQSPDQLAKFKKEPIVIKEGVEYSVGITFHVENEIVSGLRFLQVVKRAGMKGTYGNSEEMLGSYGPNADGYRKIFATEESPSGMLARSGSYQVVTRVIDDDNQVWLNLEWTFKLAKEW